MRRANRIFFPTRKYAEIFRACQIKTFPNPTTYRYQRSRLMQQLLFEYLQVPHPRSRIYFGRKQKESILSDFQLPVVVMGASNTSRIEFTAHRADELKQLTDLQHSIIIREHYEWSERIELVYVQFECIGMLRSTRDHHGRKVRQSVASNPARLTTPLHLTKQLVRAAQLDDILIEWGFAQGRWLLIGMERPPVKWPAGGGTMNRHRYVCEMIQCGIL